MSNLNDARFESLRSRGYTGSTNDMLYDFWGDLGGTGTLNDRMNSALKILGFSGHINDRWDKYLQSLGHSGDINDKELQFWLDIIPALGFTPTISLTSGSPSNLTNDTGILLADSGFSQYVERLKSVVIVSSVMHGQHVVAISDDTLYVSNNYGNTYQTISVGATGLLSVDFNDNTIIITGQNEIHRYNFSDGAKLATVSGTGTYSYCRYAGARLHLSEFDNDGIDYSDDNGSTIIPATIPAGDPTKVANVRMFSGTNGFAWNGLATFTQDEGENYTAYTNFPVSADFSDSVELQSGRKLITHDSNGIYIVDSPYTSGSTFTLSYSGSVKSIGMLSDRVIANVDGGIIYSTENGDVGTWVFVAVTEFGTDSGSIFGDDYIYITSENDGTYLTNEDTDNFLVSDVPFS